MIQLLKNYCRSMGVKTGITVGIIGYPNVGKSSVINSLKRTRAVQVGATPGLTKSMQEVHLDKLVKLLDCPGIVFNTGSGVDAVLRNAVKIEQLEDPLAPSTHFRWFAVFSDGCICVFVCVQLTRSFDGATASS